MAGQTYTLGIDVGTTGCKALLVDTAGVVAADVTTEYPMSTPKPLWAEQNPEDWWSATVTSIRHAFERSGIHAEHVGGVGLTGQMHGLVLLDAQGNVLRPCIMWNDQRTGEQCTAITRRVGARKVLGLTGNPVLPGFTAPKIVWVRENEPDGFKKVAHVLLPKDYIRYRLTGEFFSEVSDASGTSLFDVGQRRWSSEMLAALDIPRAWLPEVTESPVASAIVNAAAASQTGLAPGTAVVGGGGDQAAQAVGSGIISEGLVSATLGTSGVVFAVSDSYRVEPEGRLHAFCHAVPGKWHLMGVMLSAAGSFRWYRDTLGQTEVTQAKQENRAPHPDPNARGAFIGLTLRHTKAHLTRAVLEGVSYGMCDSLRLMRALGLAVRQVRASGGGARSTLWRQILADVFETEIVTLNVTQGAAYGAALLAGVGVGVYPDVAAACQRVIRLTGRTAPSAAAKIYAAYYPRYRALYPALAGEFAAITGVVTEG
jgi:xylulokinase